MSAEKVLRKFSSSISDLLSASRKDFGNEEEKLLLHNAIKSRNTVKAKRLINSKSIGINDRDGQGRTPLHFSVLYGTTEITSMLLKEGANVDIRDFEGTSPCHLACGHGMIDHFHLLIYYHVNVCSVDKAGKTPFDVACEYGQKKMLETILTCGIQKTFLQKIDGNHTASSLHLAASEGHVQIVNLLLENSWNLNQTISCGSALHLAAGNGQLQVVRYLLNAGIDDTIQNSEGLTAYQFAKKKCNRNLGANSEIRFLLKNFRTFFNAIAIENASGEKQEDLNFSIGDKIWVIEHNHPKIWEGIIFGKGGISIRGYFQSKKVEELNGISSDTLTKTMQSETFKFSEKPRAKSIGGKPCQLPENERMFVNFVQDNVQRGFSKLTPFQRANARSVQTNMHSSSFCLQPSRQENSFSSGRLSTSHSSSGFESGNFSGSPSSHSFPSIVARNGWGSAQGSDSTSGSSFSFPSLDDSKRSDYPDVDVSSSISNTFCYAETIEEWLDSLCMSYYLKTFLDQGYDLQTVARCTPADLLSTGVKNPDHRRKMMRSIQNLKIKDHWPSFVPNDSLRDWLHAISLSEYIPLFENQNYSKVSQMLDMTWEDFEDVGIKRQGHLKCLGLAIKKMKDFLHVSHLDRQKAWSNNESAYLSQRPECAFLRLTESSRSLDPPPPAPSTRNQHIKNHLEEITPLRFQTISEKFPQKTSKREMAPKYARSCNSLFDDDEPIRLNLVQTGKILSELSKVEVFSNEEEEELPDYGECPPPPAPLHVKVSQSLTEYSESDCDLLQRSIESLSITDDKTEKKTFLSSDLPPSLPPLLMDDHVSDYTTFSTSAKQTIDEMFQTIGEISK